MNHRQRLSSGTSSTLAQPLRVGQFNLPAWARYEAAMRGIFERRYYTNQGPLVRQFEQVLQEFLSVRHAVCVTNPTIAFMMASEALGIEGQVLVPALVNRAVEHALSWCGVEAVYCDVDPASGMLTAQSLAATVSPSVSAVLGANLWGDACDLEAVNDFARARGIPALFDSIHAAGCAVADRRLGSFGALEVLSFDGADILNAAGGGCVTTNDDELAARLRNIRSSYGAGRAVKVVKTSNGRMSEAQAALGLLSFEDLEANRLHNLRISEAYTARIRGIAGIRVVEPGAVSRSNHQALLCEVDEEVFGASRDALIAHLAAADVEAHAVQTMHGAAGTQPAAERIAASRLLLPVGAQVSEPVVDVVCDLIAQLGDLSHGARGATA